MKLYRSNTGLFLFGLTFLLTSSECVRAQETFKNAVFTTNITDRVACERQLNLIYGAMQEYRRRHDDNWPAKLSDLTPDFLHDSKVLICPFVLKRGGLRTWRKQFRELSPDSYTSYSFELPPIPLDFYNWRGLPKKTWRDFKLRQAEIVGSVVPIIRCHDHRPRLNLALDGRIYESEEYWEREFTEDEDLLTVGRLFAVPTPERPKVSDFPTRDRTADIRQLDLAKHYNATFTNSWQGFPKNNLAGFPAGLYEFEDIRYDARGLIQLRGSELPVEFPRKVSGIEVNQNCHRIHFLHAVCFAYQVRSTNGIYGIHYTDGREESFTLFYGREIADWWWDPDYPERQADAQVAWEGENEAAKAFGMSLRLYHAVWENPRPNAEIATLSFDAGQKKYSSGPFVIAITLE